MSPGISQVPDVGLTEHAVKEPPFIGHSQLKMETRKVRKVRNVRQDLQLKLSNLGFVDSFDEGRGSLDGSAGIATSGCTASGSGL